MRKEHAVQPILRTDLIQSVNGEIDRLQSQYPELASLQEQICSTVQDILKRLPYLITSHNIIIRRCKKPADEAILSLSVSEEIVESLSQVRRELCAHITLILYYQYIDLVVEAIRAYQDTHKPVRWGIGSVRSYDGIRNKNSPLYCFIHFWRNHVESEGDEFFRTYILPELSPQWQAAYQPKIQCPYDWGNMKGDEIAGVLAPLALKKDPARYAWSVASIYRWTSKKNEPWGSSFSRFFHQTYKEDDSSVFRREILPHLPKAWQKNFVSRGSEGLHLRCPYPWHRLSIQEMVNALTSLVSPRHPTQSRWSFFSIFRWKSAQGESWGRSFCYYWTEKYGDQAYEQFRKWLLPYFPLPWRETYKERGYIISFLPSSAPVQALVDSENDIDKLVVLAQAGNRSAFNKTLILASQFVAEKHPGCTVPDSVIERCIHIHLPLLRSFRSYLYVSTAVYLRQNSWKEISLDRPDEYGRTLHELGLGVAEKAGAEGVFLDGLDLARESDSSFVDLLEDMGIPEELCDLLTSRIQAGESLDDLIRHHDPMIASTAKGIMEVLGGEGGRR